MTIHDIFHALFCAAGVLVVLAVWRKFFRRPRVWVLDDSECDMILFKMNVKLDQCDLRYFENPENIINAYIKAVATFTEPACVIIDYFLSEKIKGDEVLKFFRDNGVKAVIITGYEGKISNIAERDIILKSPDKAYFRKVENWVLNATGLKI